MRLRLSTNVCNTPVEVELEGESLTLEDGLDLMNSIVRGLELKLNEAVLKAPKRQLDHPSLKAEVDLADVSNARP